MKESALAWVTAFAGLGVFVGTGALAWVTFRSSRDARNMVTETKNMVAQTARLADAAARQADVSRLALQADTRPWLSPDGGVQGIGPFFSTSGAVSLLRLALENVGRGIALVPPNHIRIRARLDDGSWEEVGTASTESTVIPPGGSCNFEFHIRPGFRLAQVSGVYLFPDSRRFDVEVLYRDVADGDGVIVVLSIVSWNRGRRWLIPDVSYLHEADRIPFAEFVGPRPPGVLTGAEGEAEDE